MSSIIKGLSAKEAVSPVGAINKAKTTDLMNKNKHQQPPKKVEPNSEKPKKKEEEGLHLIAEADNNLVAKQKARFYLDTYIKEHNAVYQKLVDAIYQLAKQTGVNHNDLRDAAPDIRYAKQQLIKATQNFIDLYDEALDLKMNEGQIYSTGGGAGQGYRWYKPQAAGLAEGNPVNVWAYTGQGSSLPPDMKISPLPIDIIGEPKRFVSQRYTYDITKGKAARDLFYNTSIDKANLKTELEKQATKSKLRKDENGNWVYDVYSPLLQHQKQALKYHLKHLEYMFGDPIKKEKVSKKTTDQDAEQLDEKCWDGYKQVGMKKKGKKMVPNCVPTESVNEISDFKRREIEHELRHEKNNYAVHIDGRKWKVFGDKDQAENIARSLRRKGKNATVHITGEGVSEAEVVNEKEKNGLWANIHAKRERIKRGSGERMRKPGSAGAPTAKAFRDSQKTSKKSESSIIKGMVEADKE